MIFDKVYRKIGKKKNKEPKDNPYKYMDFVILNKNIDHQGIGGKKGYIERYLDLNELMYKIGERCIGALNFVERRPDLFKKKIIYKSLSYDFDSFIMDCMVPGVICNKNTLKKYLYSKALKKNIEYYYVKIWQTNGDSGTYLGYFICSDECESIVKGVVC